MRNTLLKAAFFLTGFANPWVAWSHSDHSEKKSSSKTTEEDHGHDHDESEGDGHGEHGEKSANVGPEKGILDANEDLGIRLSPEALKNFGIETQKLSGTGPWALPMSARVQSGEETNVFRLRNGFFKRIDFTQINKTASRLTISSRDLKAGDEIVTAGNGFLRIAEIAAFGGAPEGHSH